MLLGKLPLELIQLLFDPRLLTDIGFIVLRLGLIQLGLHVLVGFLVLQLILFLQIVVIQEGLMIVPELLDTVES